MRNDLNGIWIGSDSTIAVVDDFRIAFLRIKEDLIISVLYKEGYGVVSVVYGHGKDLMNDFKYSAVVIKNSEGRHVSNNKEADTFIENHSKDTIRFDEENNRLVYITYDNKEFENELSEKISLDDLIKENEVDNSLTIAEKLALWFKNVQFSLNETSLTAMIDTSKYSILYYVSFDDKEAYANCAIDSDVVIYCRVGQVGISNKGMAMLPSIQIRDHRVGMIKDNLVSINDFIPNDDMFIVDRCVTNLSEGQVWYWTVKEETEDVIYLHGCEGNIYEICRKKQ